MLKVQYKSLQTPFEYPFKTAYGVKTHQPALLIALSMNGLTGIGEAPPVTYYQVTVEGMIEELLSKIHLLERYAFTEPARFWHFCHHLFPKNHFLVCALDMAYWNLYAQFKRKSVRDLIGLKLDWKTAHEPLTNYTIGMDDVNKMKEKLNAHPWPIYKIKMGGEEDLAVLDAIMKDTQAIFRVDANAAWTVEQALLMLPELEKRGIELIEQPLAKNDYDGMKVLLERSSIPFIADESCVGEDDLDNCLTCFDGINIKLTKCGGITPAIRMIEKIKSKQKLLMMGCMSETEIGSYAIAQFLPWLNYVDMDGPLLLKEVVLQKLKYEDGKVTIIA